MVKVWRGGNIAVEAPVYAADAVGGDRRCGGRSMASSELVIGMFRAGAEKL